MIRRLLRVLRSAGPRSNASRVSAGDLVSVVTSEGYGVIKVLATDAGGVHARLYVQRFPVRPSAADLGELTTAPFGTDHANPFSIGHLPLSYASFSGWEPQALIRCAVEPDELEGYEMWREASGGYF